MEAVAFSKNPKFQYLHAQSWVPERWQLRGKKFEYVTTRRNGYHHEPDEVQLCIMLGPKEFKFLPPILVHIVNAILESKYMLDFDDNWDGEGSPKYNYSTWKRTVQFLINLSVFAFNKMSFVLPAPKIYHSSDASIDVLWENTNFRLLINIPENEDLLASFYGDDYNSQKVEGTFNPTAINTGILLSLMEFNSDS